MKLVSRASRPGLTVGVLRILFNGLCTAQRFHTEDYEQMCRVGCPNEPDSLSHYNECTLLYDMFRSFWRQATVLPRRNHLLHDLITQVFLRSLQCWIVVMGFLDAFCICPSSAPSKHREFWKLWGLHERENPLHDCHHLCLRSRIPGNMSNKTHACCPASQLPLAEAQSQISASSSNVRRRLSSIT